MPSNEEMQSWYEDGWPLGPDRLGPPDCTEGDLEHERKMINELRAAVLSLVTEDHIVRGEN